MLTLIALLVVAPVMAVIALVLWCESPGHIIFRQQRLGLYGKRFTLYKFRKFSASWGSQGPAVTVSNDVRLTKIGAVLERTKLDELPQLWNIAKGEMSFVGPRPESPQFADLFVDRHRALLEFLPGLFGPSSLRECDLYPPDEDPEAYYRRVLFPQKAEYNLAYYPTATLLSDFIWIVKGVWESTVGAINWKRLVKSHGVMLAVDILLVEVGWLLTNFFRFSGLPGGKDFDSFLAGLWIFPALFLICALGGRCYRYPKGHFSLADGTRLIIATSIAWMAGFLVLVGISRSVSLHLMPMGWFVVATLLIIGRTAFSVGGRTARLPQREQSPGLLIYGFNGGGIALANWIKAGLPGISLLGFLTDDREQVGRRVHGVPILGSERDLPTIRSAYEIDEIWMTFTPDHAKRHRLRIFCQQHDIKLVVFAELEPFRRFVAPAHEGEARCETGRAQNNREPVYESSHRE